MNALIGTTTSVIVNGHNPDRRPLIRYAQILLLTSHMYVHTYTTIDHYNHYRNTNHEIMPLPARLSPTDISSLLTQVDNEVASAQAELLSAKPIAEAAGLSVHSSILDPTYQRVMAGPSTATTDGPSSSEAAPQPLDLQQEAALVLTARQSFNPLRGTLSAYPLVLTTSGGYSNNDHILHTDPGSNNTSIHTLSEFKRSLKKRHRRLIVESRAIDRWDLPRRIPGGRRRRIKRDADLPSAPPEPPSSGYVIFVSQMTTKLRYDNPNRHHNQINAVRKISALWNGMGTREREHYKCLARDATCEYEDRLLEYRATGSWTAYSCIQRLDKNKNGVEREQQRGAITGGPWVRIPMEKKNMLEMELEGYDQVIFPPRPREMEEEYERRLEERKVRRRKRMEAEGRCWD